MVTISINVQNSLWSPPSRFKDGYGNVPQGDRAFTFDKTDQTCKLFRTPSSFLQSTFEMTGDGAMTIHSRGTFKMIFKITGYQMKLTQSMDEFSYDTVYTKCTCPE
ncbi:Hypp4098 [Branchiostoma lanceolatum]|uniref:Hypp4098 protein n=1 Tax=Branchiostoma lanceolatum TaxID=7740 RepID=A0A8K0A806_BRALA|nr:Hypp4098 [Branchiostoma lanceolatum]